MPTAKLSDIQKPVDEAPPPNEDEQSPSLGSQVGNAALDTFTGVGKGFASTANNLGKLVFPDALVKRLGMHVPTQEEQQSYFAPKNTAEAIGKGIEQAGEFLVPGGAEEELAAKAPQALRPIAKIGTAALSSGLVNKAQGGSFKQGAATGVVGGAAGEGMRALAPKMAESALGIWKGDRAFGRDIGKAALTETKGVRPSTVASSAKAKIGELTPQLEQAADAASTRATPKVRGFLQPPAEEVPLPNAPSVRGKTSKPIVLNQADRPFAPALPAPRVEVPLPTSGNFNSEGVLEPQGVILRPQEFAEGENGMGRRQFIGQIPGERGGPGPSHGVFMRRPEMSASVPPESEPNPIASLRPARGIVSGAMDKAASENASALYGQLGDMNDFLKRRFVNGEQIPEDVTPRDVLNLKRGFSDQFLRWNPETHEAAEAAGRKTYGALNNEFEQSVPAAAPLNRRISNLIPVARRAESASRNAPPAQMLVRRFAAPTGALALPAIMGAEGYREGGAGEGMKRAAEGLAVPLLLSSPQGQMAFARTFNSGIAQRIPRALLSQGVRWLTQSQGEQ